MAAPQQYLEDQSMDPAMVVESADYVAHEENQLSEALSSLDARSRDIVARRWLSEPKATLRSWPMSMVYRPNASVSSRATP